MKKILLFNFLLLINLSLLGQNVIVRTLLSDLNASGGVTTDTEGNVYISDFGSTLANPKESTKVYKWDVRTGKVSVFADGFQGASGACFDKLGNFYQSNPAGNSISKISKDGTIQHNWINENLKTPIGITADDQMNIYVCNCRGNSIGKITPTKTYEEFASSELFKCPNGLTRDDRGNLYACNFNDGKILKITPQKVISVLAELPVLTGGPAPVGNGHLTWSNGFLFVATIGPGEIYRISLDGNVQKIAGKSFAFNNNNGSALEAGFSKPNGIAASVTGDTLYINVSEPAWTTNPPALHPAHLRMITGICSLPGMNCAN